MLWYSFLVCPVTQSSPTLLQLHGLHPTGSSVHGIFQARILEQFAIFYSRGSSQPRKSNPCLLPWQVGSLPTEQREAHKLSGIHGHPGVGLVDRKEVTALSLPPGVSIPAMERVTCVSAWGLALIHAFRAHGESCHVLGMQAFEDDQTRFPQQLSR